MPFVQVVEYQTDQPDEVRAISEEWSRQQTPDGPARVTMAEDRENPGRFMVIAEFDSYEHAMEHSSRPETASYADKMRRLASTNPRFVNLEVTHQEI